MEHKSQRIRITEPGWKGYTGPLGGVMFEDALSVEIVDAQTAARLGSILRIELVDSGNQAGFAAELKRMHDTSATVVAASKTGLPEPTTRVAEQKAPTYTREQLEAIADKDGIAGLRAIAEPLGIKGRGISELISEILAAVK